MQLLLFADPYFQMVIIFYYYFLFRYYAGNPELLKETESIFQNIESDYITKTIDIPSNNPIAKILTVKASRNKFIEIHNLIELKWEEGNKMKGLINY